VGSVPKFLRRHWAANLIKTVRQQPLKRVVHTILIAVFITTASILCALLLQPPLSVGALDQQFAPRFQTPALNLCGSAEAINEGTLIHLRQIPICSPIRPVLDIPGPIPLQNIGHRAISSSGSHGRISAPDPKPLTAAQQIAKATSVLQSALTKGAWDLYLWLLAWVYGVGLAVCAFAGFSWISLIDAVRWRRRRCHYSWSSKRRFLGIAVGTWLVLGTITVLSCLPLTSATNLDAVFGVTPATATSYTHPPAVTNANIVGASDGNSLASDYGEGDSKGWCFQSADNLGALEAQALGQPVANLACSGATVMQGLLNPQPHPGGPSTPAQIPALAKYPNLKWVILTDGEDELGWSSIVGLCYVPDSCNDQLIQASLNNSLTTFTGQYDSALTALANLRSHPKVLVNLLPDPFLRNAVVTGSTCPALGNLTAPAIQVMVQAINELNAVLAAGAIAHGFRTVTPNPLPFCSPGADQAYQPVLLANGMRNPRAFHPTLLGEEAYAIADFPFIKAWSQ
jgi:hypothetical protein